MCGLNTEQQNIQLTLNIYLLVVIIRFGNISYIIVSVNVILQIRVKQHFAPTTSILTLTIICSSHLHNSAICSRSYIALAPLGDLQHFNNYTRD